jgi:hypothetical protein
MVLAWVPDTNQFQPRPPNLSARPACCAGSTYRDVGNPFAALVAAHARGPDNRRNGSYTFEFHVNEPQHDGTTKEGRIDLYKRACFVLESKKFQEKVVEQSQLELAAEKMGAVAKRKKNAAPVRDTDRWDDAMLKAFVQARDYVRALPTDEPAPPFLLVVDVGHVIEAVEAALHAAAAPIAPAELAAQFARAKPADVTEILKTLETFGRARKAGEGKFRA